VYFLDGRNELTLPLQIPSFCGRKAESRIVDAYCQRSNEP